MDQGNTLNLYDNIIESAGYGKHQVKNIVISFFLFLIYGLQVTITSNIYIPYKNYLKVNDITFAFLSSTIYLGFALGSLMAGKLSHIFNRKYLIFLTVLFSLFFQILISFLKQFYFAVFLRFFIGLMLGIAIPLNSNMLLESLPIKLRNFYFTLVWISYAIGALFVLYLGLIFTSNFEVKGVPYILGICGTPNLFLCIIYFFIYEDNPRYLISKNYYDEAFEILNNIAGRELNEEERLQIISLVNEGINKELDFKLRDIFIKKFLKSTILIIFIWILLSYMIFSTGFSYQITLSQIKTSVKQFTSPRDIIISQIILNASQIPSYFLAGAMSEMKTFGRIHSIVIFNTISSITLIFAVIFLEYFALFYTISSFFISGGLQLVISYSSEIYPTKLRDNAIGFFYFCYMITAFLSQYGSVGFDNILFLLNYYICIGFLVISIILVFNLPYETYEKPLDFDYNNEEQEKMISK